MSDWSPLASSDPVPGDPGAVATLARRLGTTAEVLITQADRLRGVDAGCWEGEAATEFRARQGELAPKLTTVATRYRRVASSLDRYHPELNQAQTTARRALAQARQAEADLHGARQGMAQMEAHALAAQRAAAAANAADPDAPPRAPAPWPGPDHHARLAAAQAEMEAARRLLRQAEELRDGAASTCAGAIRDASDDGLADEGGVFGLFKRAASAINDALPVIAKVLAVAAAVVGVLSIFLPVLAPLALALGALVLVLDSILVATGRGSWVDVALGVLGLATFGLSRAFGVAARAGGAARGTGSGVVRAQHALRSQRGSQQGMARARDGWRARGPASTLRIGPGEVLRSRAASRAARGGAGPVRQGAAGVERTIDDLEAAGGRVLGREITIQAGGVRTRPDLFVELPSGQRAFLEVKTGASAALTQNQTKAFPQIWAQGGVARGANAAAAGLTPGSPIGPTRVWVVRQSWPL